jgi:hypothetical protein
VACIDQLQAVFMGGANGSRIARRSNCAGYGVHRFRGGRCHCSAHDHFPLSDGPASLSRTIRSVSGVHRSSDSEPDNQLVETVPIFNCRIYGSWSMSGERKWPVTLGGVTGQGQEFDFQQLYTDMGLRWLLSYHFDA